MSAPTTAEVREALAKAGREVENCHHSAHEDGLWDGRYEATYDYAIPLAEHRDAAVAERDALAAEVTRLKAQVQDVCEANREDVDGLTALVDQERAEVARLREALAASEARAAKAAVACEELESLVDYSSSAFHDSTRWESEAETAALWKGWRGWAYDAIKAAKGAER